MSEKRKYRVYRRRVEQWSPGDCFEFCWEPLRDTEAVSEKQAINNVRIGYFYGKPERRDGRVKYNVQWWELKAEEIRDE